jgi:uncharacterized protein with HEPN domain
LPSKNAILRLEDILENIGLIEEYNDRVDPTVIWRIVSDDLNSLKRAVVSAINQLRRESPEAS